MQKLQLSIPEPCHENWQQMTPTDQGRFCNACAKEVVDFSTMTDMQVLNYFSTLTHEKVCGRALPEQLNRTISRPEPPKKRLFWYWNYIVMFLMFFTKGNAVKAQGGIKPVAECSPVKTNDIRGEVSAIGKIKTETSRVITGKVTDIDGTPISFASVKVKNTNTGISADANGAYSIRVKDNSVLIISGATFKPTMVTVGSQNVLNFVLEKDESAVDLKVVTVGGMLWSNQNIDYAAPDKIKAVAIIKVKDEGTGKFLQNASIEILTYEDAITGFTDTKGTYKIKGIKKFDNYFIKVKAEGYEAIEFTINETDFKDRKKEWEILLRKQKVAETGSTAAVKPGTGTRIRMGAVIDIDLKREPLYVVDGTIMPAKVIIDPADVEDVSVLKGPEAAALFGPDGVNGAIVITTKKKVKTLDPVSISSYGTIKGQTVCTTSVMGGMATGVTVRTTIADTLKMIATKINGAIKIYPNPVQRGNTFNIALKLKQTGLYQIQITDATRRIVLQKNVNAVVKEFTETIAADSRWSSGVYYISLIDSQNKLINKNSFIFQ